MKEPIRWVQTNLRETDAAMDTQRLVGQLAEMRANVVLMGMGGISAYYPTEVEFHHRSPYLPAGKDMFGDVLREATDIERVLVLDARRRGRVSPASADEVLRDIEGRVLRDFG